jgi:hypothetical protein
MVLLSVVKREREIHLTVQRNLFFERKHVPGAVKEVSEAGNSATNLHLFFLPPTKIVSLTLK